MKTVFFRGNLRIRLRPNPGSPKLIIPDPPPVQKISSSSQQGRPPAGGPLRRGMPSSAPSRSHRPGPWRLSTPRVRPPCRPTPSSHPVPGGLGCRGHLFAQPHGDPDGGVEGGGQGHLSMTRCITRSSRNCFSNPRRIEVAGPGRTGPPARGFALERPRTRTYPGRHRAWSAFSVIPSGNDMSSRDIEGENPLYLPQAKVYDRSAALGPCCCW